MWLEATQFRRPEPSAHCGADPPTKPEKTHRPSIQSQRTEAALLSSSFRNPVPHWVCSHRRTRRIVCKVSHGLPAEVGYSVWLLDFGCQLQRLELVLALIYYLPRRWRASSMEALDARTKGKPAHGMGLAEAAGGAEP